MDSGAASDYPKRLRPALADSDALYVSGEDHLRVTSFNGTAGVELAIEGRFLDYEGRVVPLVERHIPNVDRTAATSLITLGEGFLSNVMVRATAGSPLGGSCFVVVELVRGRLGALQPLACLLQGYASANQRLAWPGTMFAGSTQGSGLVRSIVGTDPAAGVEILETVPAGARWSLRSFRFVLVASAAVANRRPTLIIDDGANELWRVNSNVNQIANETSTYEAGAGAPFATLDVRVYSLPLPVGLVLPAGARIRTSTAALDAADNYAAPQYLIEEWIAG